MPFLRVAQRRALRAPLQPPRAPNPRLINRPPPPSISRMQILQPPAFQATMATVYPEFDEYERATQSFDDYYPIPQYDERRKMNKPSPVQTPILRTQQNHAKKLAAPSSAPPVRRER